jgi:hypothetical protein
VIDQLFGKAQLSLVALGPVPAGSVAQDQLAF